MSLFKYLKEESVFGFGLRSLKIGFYCIFTKICINWKGWKSQGNASPRPYSLIYITYKAQIPLIPINQMKLSDVTVFSAC